MTAAAVPMRVVLAVLMALVAAITIALTVTMPRSVPDFDFTAVSTLAPLVPYVATGVISLLLVTRRPANVIGWLLGLLVLALTISGISDLVKFHYLYGHDVPLALLAPLVLLGSAFGGLFPLVLVQLLLVFPDGHLRSRRWLWAVGLSGVLVLVGVVNTVTDPTALGDGHRQVPNPVAIGDPGGPLQNVLNAVFSPVSWLVMMLVGVTALVLRYRSADSDERQQVKWFGVGVVATAVGIVVGIATSTTTTWTTPIPVAAEIIGFSALPLAIGVALTKYHLYDIDVVISRTLVYGSLAALITAIYVGIVVGIGTIIGSGGRPNLVLSIVATAVVALGFQPVRERLQRVANRLVYGKRATPYEVLSAFAERVAESYAGDDVLPRMARVLAEGTGAESATVWLRAGTELRPAASYPESANGHAPLTVTGQMLPAISGADRAVPVRHQGELLGALVVSKRPGESLTPIEEKLLGDLANQAGLVLKNVGLTADLQARLNDLQASRQRLVKAQDDERRRLERNLHDGAQQNLVALKIKLGLVRSMTPSSPAKAKDLLHQLKDDTDETLETLRDLARGIYPPLLAARGLREALVAQARRATLPVMVEAGDIRRYPQEAEAAIYFCILEALQNVQKYAGATRARVSIHEDGGELVLAVEDDGSGFDQATVTRGSGLANMKDRLESQGGTLAIERVSPHGTRISGRLPVAVPDPVLTA